VAEFSSFFNSLGGDRRYPAEKFAEYFASFLTSGIRNGGTNLQVYAEGDDYFLRVTEGKGFIEGYFYVNDSEKVLTPATADTINPRIDRVVLRLDVSTNSRFIRTFVKTGTPAGSPVAPTLERDLAGSGIYELSLAQILIPANATTIPAENVTDERLDTDVCGLVNSLIQADTTDIFNQFQLYYNSVKSQFDIDIEDYRQEILDIIAEFQSWFDDTKADYNAWYTSIKATIFDAVYFDFNNWRYRAGHTYSTEFDTPTPGDIRETIKNTISEAVVATITTEFDTPSAGQIQETLYVVEDDITIRKITTFNLDGSIDAAITEVI
jgi:hypothetical protein